MVGATPIISSRTLHASAETVSVPRKVSNKTTTDRMSFTPDLVEALSLCAEEITSTYEENSVGRF